MRGIRVRVGRAGKSTEDPGMGQGVKDEKNIEF